MLTIELDVDSSGPDQRSVTPDIVEDHLADALKG